MNSQKPAIILITADQLRKDAVSCYGGKAVETPNLDQLASQSIRFDRAYATSPWCLPSRCSILTGLLPHNHRAYSNFRDCKLNPDIPNLYNLLREGGYSTCHIGKCHYAPVPYNETQPDKTLPYDDFRQYYLTLGMDHLELQDDKQVSVWFYDDYSKELDEAGYLSAYRDEVWNIKKRKVFSFPAPAKWHPDSWVGRKAKEFIEEYVEDKPLFMWVSFSGPHFPFDPPEEYYSRVNLEYLGHGVMREDEFDDPERIHYTSFHGPGGIEGSGSAPGKATKNYSQEYWTELRRNYFANVALIDEQIGLLLKAIQRRFGNNALIIFTADHGEMLGNHYLWGKHNCGYEDVLNVPLLVRYPNQLTGSDSGAKVMLIDIMPTCLNVAGIEIPVTDGVDLQDNLRRGGYQFVFSEGDNFVSVSDGRFKYIHVRKDGRTYCELFDLSKDPYEFENLIGHEQYKTEANKLRQVLIDLFMDHLLP